MSSRKKSNEQPKEIQDSFAEQYKSILANSIQQVNNSIQNNTDPKDATAVLISDLSFAFKKEIEEELKKYAEIYDTAIQKQTPYLKKGLPESQKAAARNAILQAKKEYALNIKQVILSLIDKKVGLLHTRRAVERSYFKFPEEKLK